MRQTAPVFLDHALRRLSGTDALKRKARCLGISAALTLCLLLSSSITAQLRAEAVPVALDKLTPSVAHRRATDVVIKLMERYHYKRVAIGDELSGQIFDRYLKMLDPQRSFFLRSDIDSFERFRSVMDDALRDAKLQPAFEIFKRFRKRVDERAEFATSLLSQRLDFAKDEDYIFNRDETPWIATTAELDDLWRRRVKNDILSLRLLDKPGEEIDNTLRKRYERMYLRVAQLQPNDIFQMFVNAYTTSIEPHTAYLSPRSSENLKIRMSLSLEGIGAALQTEDEYTVVRRIIKGGPAARSKQLQVDDRIVGVGQGADEDVVDVISWRLEDVVDLIRGPKDSVVRLRILPAKAPLGSPTREIALVRDRIDLADQAAKRSVIDVPTGAQQTKVGVIRVPTFYRDTAGQASGKRDYTSTTRDVRKLLRELQAESVAGIVLDLRGNSGGLLLEAIELAGLFISAGPVVQIKDSRGRLEVNEDPDPGVAYAGPLAVLVDRGSASASEIVAGAIQDYRRGVILGEPTFGKGTVQNVAPLDRRGELGQLKLTIAQFFRVNGDGTQHRGVVPDILFPTAKDSHEQGERALENALPWASVAAAPHQFWQQDARLLEKARQQHARRATADERFKLLLDELSSIRELQDQRSVTLLEKKRKQEWQQRQTNKDQREALYQKAFANPEAASDGTDEQADIILEEAARVLVDLIDLRAMLVDASAAWPRNIDTLNIDTLR